MSCVKSPARHSGECPVSDGRQPGVRPVGGFFALELPASRGAYHDERLALTSGRACLRRIVATLKPARVLAPFYICDTVLQAFQHEGIPVEFYDLDASLDPRLTGDGSTSDLMLYVNYFGLKTAEIPGLMATRRERLVVDDTQAFFERGHDGAWAFNSARKWFGVPDGAYAYGGDLGLEQAPASGPPMSDHLLTALTGNRPLAFEQYRQSEAAVSDRFVAMSSLGARLLAGIDYAAVRRARGRNFQALHERLGAYNRLPAALLERASAAWVTPFCYPLLTDTAVPWTELWNRGAFVPRLWPEVQQRDGAAAHPTSTRLAERLMALPIDHRYGADDMSQLADRLMEIMAW